MKALALTVRQPWAWAIMTGMKRVENRNYPPGYALPIPLLIHAAKQSTVSEWYALRRIMAKAGIAGTVPGTLPTGAILGSVDLISVVKESPDAFYVRGNFGWVLRDPHPIEPVRCAGQQKVWTPDDAVMKLVTRRLSL